MLCQQEKCRINNILFDILKNIKSNLKSYLKLSFTGKDFITSYWLLITSHN